MHSNILFSRKIRYFLGMQQKHFCQGFDKVLKIITWQLELWNLFHVTH